MAVPDDPQGIPQRPVVLAVDDLPANLAVASAMLEALDVDIRLAENGQSALAQLAEQPADIQNATANLFIPERSPRPLPKAVCTRYTDPSARAAKAKPASPPPAASQRSPRARTAAGNGRHHRGQDVVDQ